MAPRFDEVVIVGVGLLGASLGLALKAQGMVGRIVGVGRRQLTLDAAHERGAIDASALELADAAKDANLVVVCTPVGYVAEALTQIAGYANAKTVITDVASTKQLICEHAQTLWPENRPFVGSHPMAGSEKFGPQHADAELFDGAVTFVEEDDGISQEARDLVTNLWESVGSAVVAVSPSVHDRLVAQTSHVPHVLASVLPQLVDDHPLIGAFVGKGFLDTTRIAEGRPEIWRDICLSNKAAILQGLKGAQSELAAFVECLERDDGEALEVFFDKGATARRRARGK